jgi:membrane protease subunit HflC
MEQQKKGSFLKVLIIALVVIAIMVLSSGFYVVHQNEYVTVRRFGKIIAIEKEPGLHFKVPVVDDTQSISAKVVLYDIPASDVITKDKKSMITDTYVLWKVSDPRKYVQTLNAIEARAEERIEASVYNATKNAISSMTQDEVIESRGDVLTGLITNDANSDMDGYGIQIVKAEIKALDLPDDNRTAVYERMISERNNIAASYTADGESEAKKIRTKTDNEIVVSVSEAEAEAEKIIAEGEAEYMKILSGIYNTTERAELYTFVRALDAAKKSMKGEKTLILSADSPLAEIFNKVE